MIYIGLMVALLLPLSYLSQPAGNPKHGDEGNFRGVLADMRERDSLSQTSIGEIDPAGATMQMVLFGFNGVAVNQLWGQAQEAQKKEDWETLRTVLNQLVKLQPHYFKVWDFQAHNLSYNLSVEFDDYRARYKQVVNGFNFLKQGIDLNKNEARLPHKLGWYIGHKIGRADEKVFYRKLFQTDWMKLFHETDNPDRPLEQRDNWLVANEKFQFATDMADQLEAKGKPLQTTPSLFYKELSHALINYAETITEEGQFDKTKAAWANADKAFQAYSFDRAFLTPNLRVVKVGEMEQLLQESFGKQNALLELVPGERQKLFDEKLNEIADDKLKEILKKPLKDRTGEENTAVRDKARELRISWQDLANRAPEGAPRTKAKMLANEITQLEEKIQEIDHLRSPLNYNYWRILIEAEKNEEAYLAHKTTFEAQELFRKGKLYESARKFEEAFCHWRWVLNKYPYLRNDSVTYDDIHEHIKKYREALTRGQPGFLNDHPNHFETFPLWDIVAIVEREIPAENVPFPPLCGEEVKQSPVMALVRSAYEAAQELAPKPMSAPEEPEESENKTGSSSSSPAQPMNPEQDEKPKQPEK